MSDIYNKSPVITNIYIDLLVYFMSPLSCIFFNKKLEENKKWTINAAPPENVF